MRIWTGSMYPEEDLSAGFCRHANELWSHINVGNCLCFTKVMQLRELAPVISEIWHCSPIDSNIHSVKTGRAGCFE
jgi:hypothetical protein